MGSWAQASHRCAPRLAIERRVRELDEEMVYRGLERIEHFLAARVTRDKVSLKDKERTMENLSGTTNLDEFADCDVVIEAIVEAADEKKKTFVALDSVVAEATILASNTSSLSITELASVTRDRTGSSACISSALCRS